MQLIGTNQKSFLKVKSNNITKLTNITNINYKYDKYIYKGM